MARKPKKAKPIEAIKFTAADIVFQGEANRGRQCEGAGH